MTKTKRSSLILRLLVVGLLFCIGAVYSTMQKPSVKPFQTRIHGTWNYNSEWPDNWISFNTLYNGLPDGQLSIFITTRKARMNLDRRSRSLHKKEKAIWMKTKKKFFWIRESWQELRSSSMTKASW